ncbi:glycosyltransferase family 2 protein [Halobaculum sp. CBA1158]|uniref:glycosyltransferase family 2 protein n=1 Tax=Halobaculum sp. CBA1158 TaxID=2904243 RepID=UPI002AA2B597|nr:glycosyltransferase family 2 protein [Halobaculum sp. CBA1158]
MYRGHTVGVVIPAYNEEPFVRETIETVPAFVDRVYVIDDASTDGTWSEIRAAAAAERDRHDDHARNGDAAEPFGERVVAIQHERNRGVGGAIKTGYLRAREDELAATAVMGGDGQMDPDVLGTLFDPILDGDADYVKGNRFLGTRDYGDMPRLRFVGNAVLGALTRIASGYWATGDPQSGYTAISRRALHEADIEEMYEFYGYCNDLLVKLNVAGLRVVDLPSPIVYGDEESHIRYRTYVPRVSWMLLRNFLWRVRENYLAYDFHPLVVAYVAGAAGSGVGLAALVWAVAAGGGATSVIGGLLATAVFMLGLLSLVGAMAMDKHVNDHLNDVVLPDRGTPAGEAVGDDRGGRGDRGDPTDRGDAVAAGRGSTRPAIPRYGTETFESGSGRLDATARGDDSERPDRGDRPDDTGRPESNGASAESNGAAAGTDADSDAEADAR